MVTPDPGVIEVNVHPAKSWKEVVTSYDILFEAALESRLGSEKFKTGPLLQIKIS